MTLVGVDCGLSAMLRILLVCMGNICRSPLAEIAVQKRLHDAGLDAVVEVQSAGTHDYHAGEAPDPRALAVGIAHGYDFGKKCARKVMSDDFEYFDWILAMDPSNLAHLRRLCPEIYRDKLALYLEFSGMKDSDTVIDPYYGSLDGFENTLDICERAADGLIDRLLTSGALGHRDAASM